MSIRPGFVLSKLKFLLEFLRRRMKIRISGLTLENARAAYADDDFLQNHSQCAISNALL